MDIRQLDYFIVVAQLGSFTKAADELFLSRQALSKANFKSVRGELKFNTNQFPIQNYYLRVIKIMYFDEPAGAFEPMSGSLRLILGLSGAFVILYVVFAGPFGAAASVAAKTFF